MAVVISAPATWKFSPYGRKNSCLMAIKHDSCLPLQTNIVWLTKTKLELGNIKEQCSGGSLLGGIGNGHLAQCSRSRGNASHGSFHCSQAGRGCRLSGWQSWRGGGAGAGGSIASSIYSLFLFCRQQPASVLPPLPTQHCVYSTWSPRFWRDSNTHNAMFI